MIDNPNSRDSYLAKAREEKRHMAALLIYRLNQNPIELSFEDATEWSKIILFSPHLINEDKFVSEQIYETLERYHAEEMRGMRKSKKIRFLGKRLKEITDDPYEKSRWRIMTGALSCVTDKTHLRDFAYIMNVTEEEAGLIADRLDKLSSYKSINLPYVSLISDNDQDMEVDVIEACDNNDKIYALLHVKNNLFNYYREMSFEDALCVANYFIDCTDEEKIRHHMKIGMRAYSDEYWVEAEINPESEELESKLDDECDELLDQSYEASSEEIIIYKRIEIARWMLLSVVHHCRKYEEYMLLFATETGEDLKDALRVIDSMEFLAQDRRIAQPLPEEKVTTPIELFIGNHQIKNPKQWSDLDSPNSSNSGIELV
jgi:hypothetical protein